MQRRPENSKVPGEDPDETLVTPRFDEEEERRAHPVVPLAAAPSRAPYLDTARAGRARGPRRSWTPALLAVALLLAAAVGGAVTTQLMRSPRAERVQEPAQEPTQAAPAQTAEAPPQPSKPSTPVAAEAPREEMPASGPTPRDVRTGRARAETTIASEPWRDEEKNDEDEDRRDKRAERRRERQEEMEKEMRKALKRAREHAKDHAKGKAPRLVDVYTPSP